MHHEKWQIFKNRTTQMMGDGCNTFQGKVYFTEHVDKPNMKQVYYHNLKVQKLRAKG